VLAALNGIAQPVVLIAGGRDKGGDYGILREVVRQKVTVMILLGEAKQKMAEAFQDVTTIEFAESMEQAVQLAINLARPGEAVMLSPACASFDMFNSYSHRGEVFREAVLRGLNMTSHGNREGGPGVKEASAA